MSQGLNYYAILGVAQDASKIQICKAYKELALKNHPNLKHENENKVYKTFCLISEAFDVLYDEEKRRIYDQYGEKTLKQGIINEKGERDLGNYTFTVEPEVIFEKFFGSKNVYEHLLEVGKGEGRSHPIFSAPYAQGAIDIESKPVAPLVVPVQCTLSELFNGCKKALIYDKRVLCEDGQAIKTISEARTIDIPPGRWCKCPIVYAEQGNQQAGEHPSDLAFQIVEVPQMGFQRAPETPDDLIYTASIGLMDALDSKSISIKQLSGQIIQVHFDEIISPQTRRKIEGKGMPRQNGHGFGDLHVKFDIRFPEQIDFEKKERIVELLRGTA